MITQFNTVSDLFPTVPKYFESVKRWLGCGLYVKFVFKANTMFKMEEDEEDEEEEDKEVDEESAVDSSLQFQGSADYKKLVASLKRAPIPPGSHSQCCGAGAGRSRYFFGRSRSRCKDVKAKTCFLLLFSLFLYEEEPEL